MTLQFLAHCGKVWMVGINGRSTDGRGSGGKASGESFVAFGNDELASAPAVPTEMPCRECGAMVRVETSKSK